MHESILYTTSESVADLARIMKRTTTISHMSRVDLEILVYLRLLCLWFYYTILSHFVSIIFSTLCSYTRRSNQVTNSRTHQHHVHMCSLCATHIPAPFVHLSQYEHANSEEEVLVYRIMLCEGISIVVHVSRASLIVKLHINIDNRKIS